MQNGTIIQYFEWYLTNDQKHWLRVKEDAKKLAENGFSAVWLPPAYKGSSGINSVGYDVYDLYDIGEFDQKGTIATKYGTKKEYEEAIKELHKNNLNVYADMVFNQKMGADECEEILANEVNPNNRNEQISDTETIKAWTKFDFTNRNNKYSSFKWNHTHFDATDFNALNNRSALYRFHTKAFQQDVDGENGNYDYLMGCDVDFDNVEVRNELFQYGLWYLDEFKVDGFRLDAVKHIDFKFFDYWLGCLRKEKQQELFAVGEYWSGNLDALNKFLNDSEYTTSLFDVPLHFNFKNASEANGNYDMRTIFDNTLTSVNPNKSVTFVDNHDSQPHQSLESFVEGWFKPLGYALILLRENGYPCVFYGDYYGIPYDNIPPVNNLAKLVSLRSKYAYGKQDDYFDDSACIGWVRNGNEEHPGKLITLLTIKDATSKKMYVGKEETGNTYYDYLDNIQDLVAIDEDGYGEFKVNGGSVSCYIKKD